MDKIQKHTTLFDHLNQITAVQDPKYFSKLKEGDLKTWSNFMIHRFLSMDYELVELIAELQPLTQSLSPEIFYTLLIDFIPKKKRFLKYIKGKNDDKIDQKVVELITIEYSCSKATAIEYYEILQRIDGGASYIEYLKLKYGIVLNEPNKKKSKK